MTDILIYESGNGGEVSVKGGDIQSTDALYNMIYLAHFGGNTEINTTGQEKEGEERKDWFGNMFLESEAQMNSNLERALMKTPLTSAGRVILEREAAKDVEFMKSLGDITTSVQVIGNDKVRISHKINQNKVDFIWDATKSEVIEEITI